MPRRYQNGQIQDDDALLYDSASIDNTTPSGTAFGRATSLAEGGTEDALRADLYGGELPGVSLEEALAESQRDAVGPEQIAEAGQILERYRSGKSALERRIIDNDLWFKMQHWKQYENHMMKEKPKPSSGWLFNSIANKHADMMDNYPEPNVLPRAADDEETAKALSDVLPVILEHADYEQVYSDAAWRKLKQGTSVKGIFWDSTARGGVGEISIKCMDILMLYWEPGISDIQDSPNLFSLKVMDTDTLVARYPEMEGHTGRSVDVAEYIHDDSIDTGDKSVVVDWYYKRPAADGQTLLHYCKFCNGVVLYASENDPVLAERGFYDHGQYPFVFDVLFQEEDSPAGFGYIDVMKDTQTSIDRMNQAMDENVVAASKVRYLVSDTAGINEDELMDLSRDVVHMTNRLDEANFQQLQTAGLQGNSLSYMSARIDEIKEVSGNRDVSQGSTGSGVTAASAIAALQEAGSKLSRDMLKSAYRAFAKECHMVIELIRQFYDEERVFRITGATGQNEYVGISGDMLRAQPGGMIGGVQLAGAEPIFDVTVSAAKKSTFSRLSQNETAKECYQLGFFSPANADASLACLEMMDFEGIEKVRERVQQNGTMYQTLLQMQQQMQQMAQIIDMMGGGTTDLAGNVASATGNAVAQAAGGKVGSADKKTTTNSLGAQVGDGSAAAERAMNVTNITKQES